jgi:hypothetical protein
MEVDVFSYTGALCQRFNASAASGTLRKVKHLLRFAFPCSLRQPFTSVFTEGYHHGATRFLLRLQAYLHSG